MTKIRVSSWLAALGAAVVLTFASAQLGSARAAQTKTGKAEKSVYVCSCMKTKSCPCMTMAKKEGKCACGAHSPEMKKVAADSDWAKTNRKALE
jgi:hypothetical protein